MITKLFKIKQSIKPGISFYVSDYENIFYLTGFNGSFARLIINNNKNYFITDKRYTGISEKTGIDKLYEVIITNNYKREITKILKNSKKILISPQTPLAEYLWFIESGRKPVISNVLSVLRTIKDSQEIEIIKKSVEITEKGILYILSILKNNITEVELANEFEYYIRKKGADSVSFPVIIAFGKNSSIPHYKTGIDKLKENTLILIDAGVKYKGYCSDLTRIIGYRIIKSHLKKCLLHYNIVKTAKKKATLFYKNRNLTAKPYIIVKKYLKKYRLDGCFTHSLGHGIGVEIHENPYINQKSVLRFKPGMIVTCEPGIYFPGEYGIRIEDDYLITTDSPIKLSEISDELITKE